MAAVIYCYRAGRRSSRARRGRTGESPFLDLTNIDRRRKVLGLDILKNHLLYYSAR